MNSHPRLRARLCQAAALVSVCLPLGITATAQTTPELIAFTATTPFIARQTIDTCKLATCKPSIPGIVGHVASGGTAWDATRGGVWITNGTDLMCVDGESCRTICKIHRPLTTRASITGLAVNERMRVMVVTDSLNNIHQFKLDCPIATLVSSCRAKVPSGHTIGGVATDDIGDLVLYSSSDFSGSGAPGNRLYVAPRLRACDPICSVPVARCGNTTLGPIHGVAYDACTGHVFLTEGFVTIELRIDVSTCKVAEVRCCRQTLSEPYIGLCLVPSRSESLGRSCLLRPCAACTSMEHTTIGDPALGNGSFGLALSGAPVGASAFAFFNFGACTSGIKIPGFCGGVFVPISPLPPIGIGPIITSGFGGCTGAASTLVSIPASTSLCGATFCSQFLGLCPLAIGTGTFVSNAQSWTISSS